MSRKTVSIRDVAQACQVSVATVSRVINGKGKCSMKTEQLVRQQIRELNYVPETPAKPADILPIRATGILVPEIEYEFFGRMVAALEAKLFEYDIASFICNMGERREKTYIDILERMNIMGLMVISGYRINGFPVPENLPVIYINCLPENRPEGARIAIVETDNVEAGYLATVKLIKSGCRSPLMITNRPHNENLPHGRSIGYFKAIWEYGLDSAVQQLIQVDTVSFESGYQALDDSMLKNRLFDGIFCSSDLLALGVMRRLLDAGVRVPEDVRLVGCNDTSLARLNQPSIATIRHPIDQIAQESVSLLMNLMKRDDACGTRRLLPVSFVPGETCPDV